ncbi:MAG: chromosome segregation protein SMC [Anaerococcus sp.]|nr:chromosome segregation protein SMC [Anaerococcus sp.]
MEFDDKITAVVGPNGSGKSNIADAIRWVLGEQSAKSLRGAKMNDLIFKGGESSKSLNLAEVVLNFSNEDKSLNIDYDHVKILRRVYRDGENEYRINGKKVRLKDIKELFLDTGVGKEGYSIISQGRIDQIISSSPKDRRLIFEEASGIAKHKYRRDESSKKLEKVSDDLEIIERDWEFKKRDLDHLKTYKDNYLKNKDLTEALNKDAYFYIKEKSQSLVEKEKKISEDLSLIDKEILQKTKDKEGYEKKLGPFKENLGAILTRADGYKGKLEEIRALKDKATNTIEINKQKLDYNERDIDRIGREIETNKLKREKLSSDLEKSRIAKEKIEEELDLEIKNNKAKEEEIIKLDQVIDDLKKEKSKYRKDQDDLNNLIYQIELEQKSREVLDKKRAEDAIIRGQKISKIEDQLKSFEEERESLDQDVKAKESEIDNLSRDVNSLKENLEASRASMEELVIENNKNNLNLKSAISEFKLQKETIEKNRGYFYSIQEFLNKSKEKGLDDLYLDSLANLIRVSEGYEDVIDILMSAGLQNIVTRNKEDTRKLINFVNSNRLGRVTFLPMDSIKSFRKERPKEDEVLAMAYDLVDYDPSLGSIIDHFLGSTVVVRDIDDAVSLSEKIKGYRIVSKNLDIINTWGSMVAGNDKNRKKNTDLLNRNKKLDLIKKDLLLFRNKKDEMNKAYSSLSQKIASLKDEIEDKDLDLKAKEKDLSSLRRDLDGLIIRIENSYANLEDLQKDMSLDSSEFSDVDLDEKKRQREVLIEKTEKISLDLNVSKEMYATSKEENLKAQSKIEILRRDINLAANSLASLENEIADLDETYKRNTKIKAQLEEDLDGLNIKEKDLRAKISDFEGQITKLQGDISKSKQIISDMEGKNQELIKLNKESEDRLNDLNLKRVKVSYDLDMARQNLASIMDEVGPFMSISYDKAEELFIGQEPTKVTKKALVDRQREINSIGFFNETSLQDYESAKKDFDFLDKQMKDLINSKSDIEEMIARLEEQMKEEFVKNFNIINEKFTRIFKVLFKGGDARLLLDSKDSLNAGVDIEARPPSKSPKSISLLSGGEKALTAVALLFAIFETNPAPFAILDEIDAALDEANIKRYIEYLKSLSDKTQFIMITHRQTSMTLAEKIHGVTIDDKGISKLYSIDFGQN